MPPARVPPDGCQHEPEEGIIRPSHTVDGPRYATTCRHCQGRITWTPPDVAWDGRYVWRDDEFVITELSW